MKKQFLFGMAAVAALCSCSNNEVMEAPESLQTPVTFGTYVGNSVNGRAYITDIDGLKTGINSESVSSTAKGFGVFGYYTPQGDYVDGTSTPNYMYNEEISWDGGSSAWTYDVTKYWPNNGGDKLSFYAYAPYSDGSTNNMDFASSLSDMTTPKIQFTVNPTVADQTDIVWAEKSNQEKGSVTDKVTFTFAHALARVGFKVEAMVDKVNDDATGTDNDGTVSSDPIDGETTISVVRVELLGDFYKSGTLNLTDGSFDDQEKIGSDDTYATNQWDDSSLHQTLPTDAKAKGYGFELESGDFTSVAENVTTTPQILNNKSGYIMLIPQDFAGATDADKVKIRVTYKVETSDSKVGGSSIIYNVITSSPFTFDFQATKAYTFNLHLGLTSAKFSASVEDWAQETPGTVVNVPINN